MPKEVISIKEEVIEKKIKYGRYGKKEMVIRTKFNSKVSIEEGEKVLRKAILVIMGPGYEFKD